MPNAAASFPQSAPPPCCRNCGATLQGPHCHACGQPAKGLVRPLGSVFGDLLDSVFDFDARIPRTLWPLFTRPGFLSLEYFAGRQVRYVTPFRLFFFLAVLAFFVAQVTIDDPAINLGQGNDAIASATTEAEVERARDERLAGLLKAKQEMAGTPAASGIPGIEMGEAAVRKAAADRIRQLREAQARGTPPPPPLEDNISFNGMSWDAEKNPLRIGWLPGFANDWLNGQLARGNRNLARLKQDPGAFKDAVLGAVPTTLFVLVPVFALMLKLAYLFRRRLYMEHLVVALHSHAFLCLDLLLILLLRALAEAGGGGALSTALGWMEGLLFLWMPLYLLLMQKRVYAQGWPMTLLKYGALGVCYSVLLAFALTGAVVIGLVAM